MADITIAWNADLGTGDWVLKPVIDGIVEDENDAHVVDELGADLTDGRSSGGGVLTGGDLYNAVLISLMTDRTADEDDVIVDGSGDPRGWWGDLDADRPIGSKLWLRLRSKQTDAVLDLVRNDAEQALAWLVDDGVVARVDVAASWVRTGLLGLVVTVVRTDGTRVTMAFDWAWKDI